MTENAFRNQLTRALLSYFGSKVYIQKNHGSAYSAGLPDMELTLNGCSVWVELKAEHHEEQPKTVSALQLHTLRALRRAGACAYVLCLHQGSDSVKRWDVNAHPEAVWPLELAADVDRRAVLSSADALRLLLFSSPET